MSDSEPDHGFNREKPTGVWIRDHLERRGACYVKELHRRFETWCDERGYSAASYDSFRRTVWLLKEEGLLAVARTEPGDNPQFADRRYYQVAPGADHTHPAWRDPVKERYGRD